MRDRFEVAMIVIASLVFLALRFSSSQGDPRRWSGIGCGRGRSYATLRGAESRKRPGPRGRLPAAGPHIL